MYFMLLLNLVKEWPIWKYTSLCVIYTHIVSCPWKLANMVALRGYSKVFHEIWMIFTWCWYCTLFNRVVIQVFSILCVIVKATCMMLHWHATNNTSFVEHEYIYILYGKKVAQCVVILWYKILKSTWEFFSCSLMLQRQPSYVWGW